MSQALVEDLPGVMGHELRNPLASAVTAVSLLREMVDEDDPRRSMVDRALLDLDRIAHLIESWLRLSRSGNTAQAQVEVDDLLERAAVAHGATVVSDKVGVAIDGDHALLGRALDNLLENSLQAGARNLRLAAQVVGEEIMIHVEDDGAGLREEDLGRIFEPGWSGRGSNGLGLHAVSTTVRAHRGRIQCVRLKRGTRFTLRLPTSQLQSALA